MSAYHFRGDLITSDPPVLRYRFFPTAYDEASPSGIFQVRIDTWERLIIVPSGQGSEIDRQVTTALAVKLKKQIDESKIPKTLWHVA